MIAPVQLFSTDQGRIIDFSKVSAAGIFNDSMLPTANRIGDMFSDLVKKNSDNMATQARTDADTNNAYAKQNQAQQEQLKASRISPENMFGQPRQDPFSFAPRARIVQEDGQAPPTDFSEPIPQGTYSRSYDPQYQPGIPAFSQAAQQAQPTHTGSPQSVDLTTMVKGYEGFTATAEHDYKQQSIGYGTRAKPGETSISREEADRRLQEELGKSRTHVDSVIAKGNYTFTAGQKDVLTSFAFNVGNINGLTANGTRTPQEIADAMTSYNKAGGSVNKGLVNRRASEQRLFLQGLEF